jgi:hypothetical protein
MVVTVSKLNLREFIANFSSNQTDQISGLQNNDKMLSDGSIREVPWHIDLTVNSFPLQQNLLTKERNY